MQPDWKGSANTQPAEEELEIALSSPEKGAINGKRCKEELHGSTLLLSQILHGILLPTFVVDSRRVVTYWNKALESMTGLSAAEMIGTQNHWRILYPEEKPLLTDLVLEKASEEALCRYYNGKCRKSTIVDAAYEIEDYFPEQKRWLHFTAAPLTDARVGIIGAIGTLRDITEQKKAESEFKERELKYREMSITDSLTKLHNSRHFFRQLADEVERAKRYGNPLSLMLMDIDDFKRYNDSYGHLEGDKVLRTLSDVIRRNSRASDSAFRYGGEEFTLILPETDEKHAYVAAERLRTEFERQSLVPLPGTEEHMTISIGVGSYIAGEHPSAFLRRADEAMYKAKKQGKNRVFPAP